MSGEQGPRKISREARPLSSSHQQAPSRGLGWGLGSSQSPDGLLGNPWILQGKGWAEPPLRPHFQSRHICTLSRISGNAASDKNIKDGVCAQIEKNFARAKWKVRLGWLSFLERSQVLLLAPTVSCLHTYQLFCTHSRAVATI